MDLEEERVGRRTYLIFIYVTKTHLFNVELEIRMIEIRMCYRAHFREENLYI